MDVRPDTAARLAGDVKRPAGFGETRLHWLPGHSEIRTGPSWTCNRRGWADGAQPASGFGETRLHRSTGDRPATQPPSQLNGCAPKRGGSKSRPISNWSKTARLVAPAVVEWPVTLALSSILDTICWRAMEKL